MREAAKSFVVAARDYIEAKHEDRFIEKIAIATLEDPQIPSDVSIDDMDEGVMKRLDEILYRDVQPQTVHRQLHTPVRAVINKARDPWKSLRVAKPDQPTTRWLTPEEVERLLVAAASDDVVGKWDPHRRTLRKIAFMVGTGAGPAEMLAVTADDLNTVTHEVWIRQGKTEFRSRFVYVPERAWGLMGSLPIEGNVFLTPNGRPYKIRKNRGGQIEAAFRTVREAAGLGSGVTPYTLRHTWATWFHAQHGDTVMLKKRGGWANDRMAMRYVKLPPADLVHQMKGHGWDFSPPAVPDIEYGSLAQA